MSTTGAILYTSILFTSIIGRARKQVFSSIKINRAIITYFNATRNALLLIVPMFKSLRKHRSFFLFFFLISDIFIRNKIRTCVRSATLVVKQQVSPVGQLKNDHIDKSGEGKHFYSLTHYAQRCN